MSSELGAAVILVVVHLVAIGVIVALLVDRTADLRGWWPSDGGDGPSGPAPPAPGPPDGRRGLPLLDAEPSAQRLRGPGRLGDAARPVRRRTAPEPEPTPGRERSPA